MIPVKSKAAVRFTVILTGVRQQGSCLSILLKLYAKLTHLVIKAELQNALLNVYPQYDGFGGII